MITIDAEALARAIFLIPEDEAVSRPNLIYAGRAAAFCLKACADDAQALRDGLSAARDVLREVAKERRAIGPIATKALQAAHSATHTLEGGTPS